MNNTTIHLFGEMDIDTSLPFEDVYTHAFDVSEQCGYYILRHGKNAFVVANDDWGYLVVGLFDKVITIHQLKHWWNRSYDGFK